MNDDFKYALIWLVAGCIGFAVGLSWTSGALVEEGYNPMGADSFLHARRILDTVADPAAFYQWDVRSFATEGAFIHWPWPFDLGLAWLVRMVVALIGSAPETVLFHIPTVWVFINAALMLGVCVEARLRPLFAALAMFAFFLSPMNQIAHGVGHVDHNFMELSFVLAAAWLTMRWVRLPGSIAAGALVGIALGLANGVNISLFVLQIPLLLVAAWFWWQGEALPFRPSLACAVSLSVSCLALAAFSGPLQQGMFDYSYFSWFQVYVTCSTGVVLVLLACRPFTSGNLLALVVLGVVMLVPVAQELTSGVSYLARADSTYLRHVTETASLMSSLEFAHYRYSAFIYLLPFCLVGSIWYLWRGADRSLITLCLFGLFGMALVFAQYRFGHYGLYAIYVLTFAALDRVDRAARVAQWGVPAAAGLLAVGLQVPSFKYLWLDREPGFSDVYAQTRPVYQFLEELCEARPGIVLTPLVSANYVRYHTECSVLGTALFGAQNRQTELGSRALELLNAAPERARESTPALTYVLAERSFGLREAVPEFARAFNETGLNGALLGDPSGYPAGYRLLIGIEFERDDRVLGLSRLFLVERDESP